LNLELIKYKEYEFFLWLNSHHNPFWDKVMYWVSYRFTWVPLYLILIGLIVWIEKRNSWKNIIYLILSVGLADKITSGLMKPYFERLRPCNNPAIKNVLHLVGDCGGQYGFASSHAANSFALAMGFWLLYKSQNSYIFILFFWAALVAYSRVYNGVHYPTDILVGALVGVVISWVGFILKNRRFV
jgi:undecaprenyl-diphosphatase